MTQDVSEGSGRPLPPPPVPPRPSKEAVAEAMARSRLAFAGPVPNGRNLDPDKPSEELPRLISVRRCNSFLVDEGTESESPEFPGAAERICIAFRGVRLNHLDSNRADGMRPIIYTSSSASSSPCVGRKGPPPPTGSRSSPPEAIFDQGRLPERPREVVGSHLPSPDQGRPVRRSARGLPPDGGEIEVKFPCGKTISDAHGDSKEGANSCKDCRRVLISSGSISLGNCKSSAGDKVEAWHDRPAEGNDLTSPVDDPLLDLCYRKYTGMASLRGLPPLPKSLSGVMDLDGIRMMEAEMGARSRRSVMEDLTSRHSTGIPSSPSSSQQQDGRLSAPSHRLHQMQSLSTHQHYLSQHQNGQDQALPPGRIRKQSSLDVQLALLRQEMVGLRQLDLSLLSQLWSLNESIQEFRVLLQEEQEDLATALSPPSPSPSLSSGDEDDDDDGNGDYYQTSRQQQLHYRQKRQRQQQSVPGEGPSVVKSAGAKSSSGSKKLDLYHGSSHNDSGLSKRYTPSSPSTPSSSTRSSFEFGEV